ncbi:hypothetical protein PWG71_18510 [Nocardiopsis sp. N85]|uniref:hypothetical protein n=1 Tax=Nocardiopsis sp. N85 TaxID=3029400 RepID=UPI00237EF013|nr:hypothetical protein [Nocardiopsis sp. N85]MDE3723390.1 hypothetical protein [Nocardiopsis sp. N85]
MTKRTRSLAFGVLGLLALATTACQNGSEASPVGAAAPTETGLPPLGPNGEAPSEHMSLEEAAPFLEAQGHHPAEGDLNGYEIGHLPDDVEGTPYDLDHTVWLAENGFVAPDIHEVERAWLADSIEVHHLVDDYGVVLAEREAVAVSSLYVSVLRRDDFTDVEAYLEATDIRLEEEFSDGGVRELPDGDGHYNGSVALFSPEPGVIVHLSYVDDDYWEEQWASDDMTAEGDPEEVLRIVEGITPA